MLIVAALGGNALLRRGRTARSRDRAAQRQGRGRVARRRSREQKLVVTHGNGPQIGLLALQNEAYRDVRAIRSTCSGAESDGMIGYLLEQELGNALPERHVASLLTQTVVDPLDPAFEHPTKPIGPMYDAETAQRLAAERGWSIAPDGNGWRRVVASPLRRARSSSCRRSSSSSSTTCWSCAPAAEVSLSRSIATARATASKRSSTRTSPPRSWPSSSAPICSCCSPTSPRSSSTGERRRRGRSAR